MTNHANYNFLDCDWFKKLLFSTYSIAKLLLDSSLLDSSISQLHSELLAFVFLVPNCRKLRGVVVLFTSLLQVFQGEFSLSFIT